MKSEQIVVNGRELLFEFDENALGRDFEVLQNRGIEIARIHLDSHLFSLESNGEDDDFYLEVVMYGDSGDHFSDPIYEIPKTKEEAKEVILDWFNDEIKELID